MTDNELDDLLSDPMKRKCADYSPFEHTRKYWNRLNGADHLTRMLYTDLKTSLPGGIMVKVDRMTMAHSIEVRAPFLDYEVIEFAARLPSSWKIKRLKKKYILKKVFSRILPQYILNRKKQGFTVPLDIWFRNDLKKFTADSILNKERMGQYFSMPQICSLWGNYQTGRSNHTELIWTLLSFALWHMKYIE